MAENEIVGGESAQQNLSAEEVSQLDAYSDNATKIIYSEKSQAAILQELQTFDNPVQNIAEAANHIHRLLQESMEKDREQMTDKVMFLGATHVVSELINLAESAGLFSLDDKGRIDALQSTLMVYFKRGIENGTIDPVELQKEIEPLLTDEQRQMGMSNIEQSGVSRTAPPSGQRWTTPPGQERRQPQQTAEVPPGLVAQGGLGYGQ